MFKWILSVSLNIRYKYLYIYKHFCYQGLTSISYVIIHLLYSDTLYPPWTVSFIHHDLFYPPWPISSTMTYFIHPSWPIFSMTFLLIMTYFIHHNLIYPPCYPPWPTFKSVNHPSLTSTGIVSLCRGRGDRRSRLNLIPLSTVLNRGSGFSSRYPQWKSTAFSFFFILMVPNPVHPSYTKLYEKSKSQLFWNTSVSDSIKRWIKHSKGFSCKNMWHVKNYDLWSYMIFFAILFDFLSLSKAWK